MKKKTILIGSGNFTSLSSTVAKVVNEYLKEDELAKQALQEPELAEEAYPTLLKNILHEMSFEEIDGKIVEYVGYKHHPDETAAEELQGKPPSAIRHSVIQVGGMAIDPCRLRLGLNYPLPLSYPIKNAKEHWQSLLTKAPPASRAASGKTTLQARLSRQSELYKRLKK